MKRSQINLQMERAKALFEKSGFRLPPFAFWSPKDWAHAGHEADEIRENALGWDVTDFGCGNFEQFGLLLFTIRNGNYNKSRKYPKTYAEKIMVALKNQITPMHFHFIKREDIINRGGGNLVLELHASTKNEKLSKDSFTVSIDGVRRQCGTGERVVLSPGESICLEPYLYHKFYGEGDTGPVMIGEVSAVNDDAHDNRFLEPLGRFPAIEEDEAPIHLLCNEYPAPKKGG